MSNLETIQRLYDAFGRGDIPAVLELMDPQIDWREPTGVPFEDQVGPEAVAQNVFAQLPGLVRDFRVDVSDLIDAGDAVVALGAYRGTGIATGAPLDADFAHVWRFGPDRRITFFRTYTDTLLWHEAVWPDAVATVPAQAAGAKAAAPTSV